MISCVSNAAPGEMGGGGRVQFSAFANCCLLCFVLCFPTLQAQESLASLEREIGKVVGDANVIENSDVRTESVSVSLVLRAAQISCTVASLGS